MANEKEYKPFRVLCAYDTETTNIGAGDSTRAFPVLFIIADIRSCNLESYSPGDEQLHFFRNSKDCINYMNEVIDYGYRNSFIPIICAYNLAFDLQPIIYELRKLYNMAVSAQSSTNIYTLDLLNNAGDIVLRFWDTWHLELNGLEAMGNTCGIAKAVGAWNYSLIRTQDTPLTESELYYAARDVQVIFAYLKFLLGANEWLNPSMLGCQVITKTSLVRQMAKNVIGELTYNSRYGEKKLIQAYLTTCSVEAPKTYEQYAIRKACFRGGLTFTAAKYAGTVQHNVLSLDVTSMHHAFINGRYMPLNFKSSSLGLLQGVADNILKTPLDYVLKNYDEPFPSHLHALIQFENLQLKEGSAFADWHIASLAEGKFGIKGAVQDFKDDERARALEDNQRKAGFRDRAYNAVFAFGKLYSAECAQVYVNEIELYVMGLVYQWSNMRVLGGEVSCQAALPPDYVTLQSNMLFEQKTAMKTITKHYHEGTPYPLEIPATIPQGIAEQLKAGTASNAFIDGYYNSTTKGSFNGIYGTQAQDIYKPAYMVDATGTFYVDTDSVVSPERWEDLRAKTSKVFYNYGMRIVGGSRLHLVIAIELLYRRFGDGLRVLGGDTDSLKVSVLDPAITTCSIMDALEPLHIAVTKAINRVCKRIRANYPQYASSLDDVGTFEIETHGGEVYYPYHFEAWNKARLSLDNDGCAYITCAGLSRPPGTYTVENLVEDLIKSGYTFEQVAPLVLGYNVVVAHEICHSLQRHRPKNDECYTGFVTDYQGKTALVDDYQSIALYPTSRELGELTKRANMENVYYLEKVLGRIIDTNDKLIAKDYILIDHLEYRERLEVKK